MQVEEKKNIKWGIILSYGSLLVGLLGALFITNRILNLIGDYNYGLYSFVNSITTWVTVLSSALSASFLRFASIESKEKNGDVSRTNTIYIKLLTLLGLVILIIGLSTVGLLYLFKVPFGSYSYEDSELLYALFAYSIINIAITFPASVFSLFINYRKHFIYQKTLLLILEILKFAGHFLIAYFTKSVLVISIFTIFTTLFSLVLNYFFCKFKLNMGFKKTYLRNNKTYVRSLLVFSSVLVLNSVVDQINENMDKTLLGFFSIPEDVTIYQLGQQFHTYLGTLSIAISGVFAPKIHEFCARGETEQVNLLFLRVSRIQALVVCFFAFGFVSCGFDFVLWWVGPARINAYYVGIVLMCLAIMPLSVKLSIEIQRAYNKHRFRSYLYLAVAILNIGISILFLIVMPAKYAVFACLIGTAISSVICHWIGINVYNQKVIMLPMKKHYLSLLKYVSFGLISTSLAMVMKHYVLNQMNNPLLKFIIEGTVFVVSFALLIVIFDRAFTKQFINVFRKG